MAREPTSIAGFVIGEARGDIGRFGTDKLLGIHCLRVLPEHRHWLPENYTLEGVSRTLCLSLLLLLALSLSLTLPLLHSRTLILSLIKLYF